MKNKTLKTILILLTLIALILVLIGCNNKEGVGCECEVEYQTTRLGYWETENTYQDKSPTCEDETKVLAMPVVTTVNGRPYYSSNGVREVWNCQ